MKPNQLLILAMIATLSLAGCASNVGSTDYSTGQARSVQEVSYGVVTNVRQVTIQGNNNLPVGGLAGAAAGGVAGSEVGGGNGQIVGAVLGAVLGGLGGNALQHDMSSQKGLEITVKLDSGRIIAVTQGADVPFYPGDRVQILSGNGVTRVAH
ncbi:MAG: outer membrane lipoprotein [Burkholderiales bacterium]